MTQQPLTCARCGKSLAPGEEHMGQPLITAGQLAAMAVKSPALLAGPPLDEVPYCAECRPLVARQRTNEQLKVLSVLIGLLALVAIAVIYIL